MAAFITGGTVYPTQGFVKPRKAVASNPNVGLYVAAVMADNPAGYWHLGDVDPFADSSGNNVVLSSPFGTPVTTKLPALVPNMGADGCVNYAGASALQAGTVSPAHNLGDILTLEAWVKLNVGPPGATCGVISKQNGAYYLRIIPASGRLDFLASQVADIAQSTVGITDTNVHHVVATKNGPSVHLYIDGVDVTGTVTNATLVNNAVNLRVGYDVSSDPMNGRMDEVAIYPTALSPSRVQYHYQVGLLAG